jgi:hypothetical protein
LRSESNYSCLGSIVLIVVGLALIRFALPAVWRIFTLIFTGTFFIGIFIFLALLVVLGFFTYRNWVRNKRKAEQNRYARVTRVEELYASLVDRLNSQLALHQISSEELLQSEILVKERLPSMRAELIRLKEFASRRNQKELNAELREYRQRWKDARDPASREILEQNLKVVEQKRERMEEAVDEIQQKEGLLDLVYNHLLQVEEELKLGRSVRRMFPPDVYSRFGLNPPSEQKYLPPLLERSDE